MTFSIAYCYFATEILFNKETQEVSMEVLRREYFAALVVGLCASIPIIIGSFFIKKKKESL